MLPRFTMLVAVVLLLNACARHNNAGCNDVSCRPTSDLHLLTIWWQPELRNGPNDYTQIAIDN